MTKLTITAINNHKYHSKVITSFRKQQFPFLLHLLNLSFTSKEAIKKPKSHPTIKHANPTKTIIPTSPPTHVRNTASYLIAQTIVTRIAVPDGI